MKLHENETEFKAAIFQTAKHFKIRELFVEKDYWVTYILKNLKNSRFSEEVIFKGGTSISKAYGIAKRFSEDIDLALVSTDHQAMTNLETAIMLLPLQINSEKSGFTKPTYRQTHWIYPKRMDGDPEPAKENIQLELINNAKTTPNEKKKIRTLIAEHLKTKKKTALIKEFELDDFEILVLSHKRTFAEKIIALANASIKDDKNKTLKNKIRHLFDLTVLVMEEEIQTFVKSEEFVTMTNEARKSDEALSFMKDVVSTPWRDAPIFKNTQKVLKEIEATYKSELTPFIFEASSMPKISQIKKMLLFVMDPNKNQPPQKRRSKNITQGESIKKKI